jgi:predicted transcriptional regulator
MSQNDLPDGNYILNLEIQTNPISLAQIEFSWPLEGSQQSIDVEDNEPQQTDNARVLTGFWSGIVTESGTCWVFNSNEEGQVLLDRGVGGWMPRQGWSGAYQVQSAQSAPQCSNFNVESVQVITVESESPEQQLPVEQVENGKTITQVVQEEAITIAPTMIVIAASTSILSMLVLLVLNTESARIPSTVAGLWFLGLIGKTHETTDGRFQRGRLMGYLTANPGCHFRALMAALEMSNGQITHHIRILENEERIWRRKDGRLVRFYPLTNKLQPHMSDDVLPVPPLSPDPNSLQGKILSILDSDGTLGDFPTQSELADRLEKSQQLVSHHLRTLQKFGLVEKRKMGMRNRYKLTREAIFLLETNDDFTKEN